MSWPTTHVFVSRKQHYGHQIRRVYLFRYFFLKGSIVSLFLFVRLLMTVECIVTDYLIVVIMGIIIKRWECNGKNHHVSLGLCFRDTFGKVLEAVFLTPWGGLRSKCYGHGREPLFYDILRRFMDSLFG